MRLTSAALVSLLLVAGSVSASPVLTVGSGTVNVGGSVTVNIDITDAADLFAFQFDIGFDPALVSVSSVNEGAFLASGGATTFLPGTIDNTLGSVSFIGDSLIGAVPGVTGSGTLASIQFVGLAPGVSAVVLSNTLLLDSNPEELEHTTAAGDVDVRQVVQPIPEPATLSLLAAAMVLRRIGFGVNNRRERH